MEWNVSPILFEFGSLAIRWYGVLFATGFLLGLSNIRRVFILENRPLEDLEKLLITLMIGTTIGARLGHCLFYEPMVYLSNPIRILKIWEGGLASHGGVSGIMIALWIYCRNRPNQSWLWITDRLSFSFVLAGALVRIGNFFNSEIVGKATTVPWAIIFRRIDQTPRHPSQLYEALSYFVISYILFYSYRRKTIKTPRGSLIGWMFILVFSVRFLIEFTKENQAYFENHLILNMGQLLSIPFVMLGCYLVFSSRKRPI